MVGIIIGVIVAILVIYVIAGYNGFIKLKNKCEEGFATMDVYLKKRYDLIPNLVETVKGIVESKQPPERLERPNLREPELCQL